jgi:hypothetical protein
VDPSRYPAPLRARIGTDGSAALSDVLHAQEHQIVTMLTGRFEERLADECQTLRTELRGDMQSLRADMQSLRAEMSDLKADFRVQAGNLRVELLKWSFLFWVGQVAAVVGLVSVLR